MKVHAFLIKAKMQRFEPEATTCIPRSKFSTGLCCTCKFARKGVHRTLSKIYPVGTKSKLNVLCMLNLRPAFRG